jgi:biopolymer transport protein ExbB/TolQ
MKANGLSKANQEMGFLRKYYRQIFLQFLAVTAAVISIFFAPLLVVMPVLTIIFFSFAAATKMLDDYKVNSERLNKENSKANDVQEAVLSKITTLQKEYRSELSTELEQYKPQQQATKSKGVLGNGRALGAITVVALALLIAFSFIPGINLALYSLCYTLTFVFTKMVVNSVQGDEVGKAEQRLSKLTEKQMELLTVETVLKIYPDQIDNVKKLLKEEEPAKVGKESKPKAFFKKNSFNIAAYSFLVFTSLVAILAAPLMIAFPIISILFISIETAMGLHEDHHGAKNALAKESRKTNNLEVILDRAKTDQSQKHDVNQNSTQDKSENTLEQNRKVVEPGLIGQGKKMALGTGLIIAATVAIALIPGINFALFSAAFALSAGITRLFAKNVMQNTVEKQSQYNLELASKVAELYPEISRVRQQEAEVSQGRSTAPGPNFASKVGRKSIERIPDSTEKSANNKSANSIKPENNLTKKEDWKGTTRSEGQKPEMSLKK